MGTAFVNGQVLTSEGLRSDLAVVVEGGVISALASASDIPSHCARHDLEGGTLSPGFIDTQVNGGGGRLFNEEPTVETLEIMAEAHRVGGSTGLLPTLISDDLEVVDQGMRAVEAAIEKGVPGILGVHIEGPFLNLARKGIHPADKIRTLDDSGFELLRSLRRGRTLVTLAPERAPAGMVEALVKAGVVVSAGHTDATYEEMRSALDAGVSGFTHLFNAMSPLQSRSPGAVGAALEDQQAYCGLIVDGRHVSPATLRIALRTRPLDRFMLVTDAMSPAGTDLDGFTLNGRRIRRTDGAYLDDAGVLAGADLSLIQAVWNVVYLLGVDLASALRMASAAPAAFMGLQGERGTIAPGMAADLVWVCPDGEARATWVGGVRRN